MRDGSPIITRFAPSPTGFLHIGGARTALFNWAFARRHGGQFLLRIEDTDRARQSDAAEAAILDGLRWLGLDWDGAPISQYARAARHIDIAHELLAAGHAYHCYATPDELAAMRQKGTGYDRSWRAAEGRAPPKNVSPTLRFKAPLDGTTHIADAVQGEIEFANAQFDDLILLRSDGTPTYMLSVVVDDHDMGVTHIIRGDDHLTNAARQAQIYAALGWNAPRFAHIPLIHGNDGSKLSKRHGAQGVDAYREMGFIPAGLRNYLARLGWSHGDDELFTTAQFVEWFDLAAIGRAPSRFDLAKLTHVNAHHIAHSAAAELAAMLEINAPPARLEAAIALLQPHIARLDALPPLLAPLLASGAIPLDAKAAAKLDDAARARLRALRPLLADSVFDAASLQKLLDAHLAETGLKMGQIAPPLRAAVTGMLGRGDLTAILAFLGRDTVLARIDALGAD